MNRKKFTNFIEDTKLYLKNKVSRKIDAFAKYTVVSACYNVSLYLDDFFRSMVKQTIGFRDNIYLIMVDDGSTDNTPDIIKKWASKYPNNITYIHKENGGQATARNLGLKFVKTPWVTFTDPDDFLNDIYFENIDNFLKNSKERDNISIISTNMIFFYEKDNVYKDNHPLAFKFKNEQLVLPVSKMGKNVQLSAASALFNVKLLKKHSHEFPDIKPNFEDAYFIGDFLIKESNTSVVCLKNSKYFYRKRALGTSTLDNAWTDIRHFSDVFTKGYIPLLKNGTLDKNSAHVIQNEVLYDISWHINYSLDKKDKLNFLTEIDKNKYFSYIEECFKYITNDVIFAFSGAGIWHYQKLGMINCLKHENPKVSALIYIEKYDKKKKEIRLRYFDLQDSFCQFLINNKEVYPTHKKSIEHEFLGRYFITEYIYWLPIHEEFDKCLSILVNNEKSRISCKGTVGKDYLIKNLVEKFVDEKDYPDNAPWLLMDRAFQADDNAEHLYRWIMRNHPEKEIYFLLPKNSVDYPRLEKEGFNLVEFGSSQHRLLSDKASKIISSHIDARHVTNYWGDGSLDDKQLIFLQHGVTKDDISSWMNSKKRIDLLVTSTKNEYLSMVNDNTLYRYTDKEVKMTGFPRHDRLLEIESEQSNIILLMPTWRSYLVKNNLDKQEFVDDIYNTNYVSTWTKLLNSPVLKKIAEDYGYVVTYAPHINMQSLIKGMHIPEYIHILRHSNESIQRLFKSCALMISDYSSVAFEFAYLEKPVLYYQFDEEEFFQNHLYGHGYFDYRRDGFGYVCSEQDELLLRLKEILENGGKNPEEFLKRINNTFGNRDTNNCYRTYEAILDLDRYNKNEYSETIMFDFISQALKQENYELAELRAQNLVEKDLDNKTYASLLSLISIKRLIKLGKMSDAITCYEKLADIPEQFYSYKNEILLDFFININDYASALIVINNLGVTESNISLYVWLCKQQKNTVEVQIDDYAIENRLKVLLACYIDDKYDLLCKYLALDECGNDNIFIRNMSSNDSIIKNFDDYMCLIVCDAAIQSGHLDLFNKLLKRYEKNHGRDRRWRILSAMRSNIDYRKDWYVDVYKNLEIVYPSSLLSLMTINEFDMYLSSLSESFLYKKVKSILNTLKGILCDFLDKGKSEKFSCLLEQYENAVQLKKYMQIQGSGNNELFDYAKWYEFFINSKSFFNLKRFIAKHIIMNSIRIRDYESTYSFITNENVQEYLNPYASKQALLLSAWNLGKEYPEKYMNEIYIRLLSEKYDEVIYLIKTIKGNGPFETNEYDYPYINIIGIECSKYTNSDKDTALFKNRLGRTNEGKLFNI